MVHGGQPLWCRSSACGNETECVEVAVQAEHILARDAKAPTASVLQFTAVAWADFLRAVTQGKLEGQ
ncbi:DUF397 domain-containing protein [Streptomyces sp. NBC_00885]|uniref:DUF397 domain-containing protein n=1 Tax=Streptomyces sp. NBC_00885 TaxID=2975857 RepID=UPI00386D4265